MVANIILRWINSENLKFTLDNHYLFQSIVANRQCLRSHNGQTFPKWTKCKSSFSSFLSWEQKWNKKLKSKLWTESKTKLKSLETVIWRNETINFVHNANIPQVALLYFIQWDCIWNSWEIPQHWLVQLVRQGPMQWDLPLFRHYHHLIQQNYIEQVVVLVVGDVQNVDVVAYWNKILKTVFLFEVSSLLFYKLKIITAVVACTLSIYNSTDLKNSEDEKHGFSPPPSEIS